MQQGGRFCGYGCFGINFVRQLTKVRGHFGLQRGVEEEIFSEPFYFTLTLYTELNDTLSVVTTSQFSFRAQPQSIIKVLRLFRMWQNKPYKQTSSDLNQSSVTAFFTKEDNEYLQTTKSREKVTEKFISFSICAMTYYFSCQIV